MIVYAPSYQSIFLIGWLLSEGNEVTVLTGHKNLINLLNEWKISVIELPETFSVYYKNIIEIKSNKVILDALLKDLNGEELYFAFNAYDIRGFYIAQWFISHNKPVYWKDLDPIRPVFSYSFRDILSKKLLKTLLKKLLVKYYLRLNLQIVGTSTPILGVSKKYLHSLGVKCINTSERCMRKSALEYFPKHASASRILVATEGPSAYEVSFNRFQYWEVIDQLFKTFDNDISIKFHPSLSTENIKQQSPFSSWQPIEFILHNTPIVMGVYSASLIAAAQNESTKVISILELVDWHTPDKKIEAVSFLMSDKKASERIIYPNSIGELLRLLEYEID